MCHIAMPVEEPSTASKAVIHRRLGRPKSGHRMAAEGMPFSWRWNGDTISLNLGVIWGMSDQAVAAMDTGNAT
jgi:hypothetical protein